MYLLDTYTISELRKVQKGRANANVMEWIKLIDKRLLCTSVVVLMEIERGILGLERKDPLQAKHLRQWIKLFMAETIEDRILTIDDSTAEICATLHVPDRSPENDAWIAAQAIQHSLTVVTRNSKDFQSFHVRVFNPFDDIRNNNANFT